MPPTFTYCAETHRWQCQSADELGLVTGIGETPALAEADWTRYRAEAAKWLNPRFFNAGNPHNLEL